MVARIEPGARATFLAEGGLRTVGAEVLTVDSTRAQRLDEAPDHPREQRGQVRIDGDVRSLAWEAAKGVLAVLVRESGFCRPPWRA